MTVKLGLVGTGTVGGGCIDILKSHREEFKRHYGIDVELVRVCSRNPEQAIEHGVEDIFTQDFHDILNDPDIDIVIELIGGTTVARDVVLGALRAGKNVVTANKALMATHGEEVMRTAEEAGKEIAFEASVGGGIPIIDPMKHSLIANRIDSVMGIVNGTTNYMLTRMAEDDMPYADVLAEAQAKGFAEADPTADVDGFDAAAKIAILASIAFNSRVTIDDVHTEGIRNVLHSFPDHGTRHLVDGSRSHRLFQAFFCHPAHASASVNIHAAFLFLTHRSVDQKAMGGIRVVPAVLSDRTGNLLRPLMDIQNLQMEQNPLRGHKIDVFHFFSGQEHPRRRLCSSRRAGAGGVAVPEFFVVFDHIVIFQSILHGLLPPFP